ncbi:uncharacterized protein LOC121045739 [Ixodes scapularis]|uniref:uncharacterized protein LOC121045739 n=1 Tax=Ixodes scapularis TaxID=6945 RepID=UPI001C392449|nr:uncharacterized protein LOC121045739 [Ixodes scapularis]
MKAFLLLQVVQGRKSAAPLLARIAERPESRLGQLLCVLGDVAGPAPAITPLPPLHSDPHPLTVHLRVDGMGPQRRTADVVAKQLTEDHIERHHPGWARVYTDGSVRPSDGSSTAAVFVERADLGVGERFAFHATSTTTELAAILLALRLIHYKSRRPDSWLLLSDSQAALSQLYGLEGACPLAREIAGEALLLGGLGHRLAFQWVPSHCGIPGNERADALADRVHDAAEFRTSDVGPFADAKLLIAREAAANHPDERYAAGDRPAKPPRGTGRPAAAVVHRIRTGCALTPARMHLLRNEADPECPTCGEWSDLDHLLLTCPAHADARAAMTTSLAALGLPCNTTEQILRPRGDRRGKDRMTDDCEGGDGDQLDGTVTATPATIDPAVRRRGKNSKQQRPKATQKPPARPTIRPGERITVLVRPTGTKGQFNATNKLKIARALTLATNGRALATRVNTRRNVAAVDLDSPEAIDIMLGVKVLHNIAVTTYLSKPTAQSRGIVRPRFEAETAEVVEVRRLRQTGTHPKSLPREEPVPVLLRRPPQEHLPQGHNKVPKLRRRP